MSHEIKMPRLDDEVDEGVLVTWFVTPGQQVHTGQRIAELQVEKVSSELEATVDGRLVELRVEPGEVVQFGEVIAVMDDGPVEAVELGTAPAPGEDVRSEQPPPAVKASPAARRVAHELGVDLAGIDGSGPNGRIVERDVRDAATAPAEPPHETGRPLSPLRRTMAQKLHHWVSETAQFTLSAEADVTNLAEALRALRAGGRGPSYLAAVVRATALTLRGHPGLTASSWTALDWWSPIRSASASPWRSTMDCSCLCSAPPTPRASIHCMTRFRISPPEPGRAHSASTSNAGPSSASRTSVAIA